MMNEETKAAEAQALPDAALEQVAGGSRNTKESMDMLRDAENTKRRSFGRIPRASLTIYHKERIL